MLSRATFGTPYRVQGNSMEPALMDGHQVLATPIRSDATLLSRGALVVLRHPVTGSEVYIKRVVGLPGEYLCIDGDEVYVDDALLAEPYLPVESLRYGLAEDQRETARLWITDDDEYFVLGDRRSDSQDSRSFGPVPRKCILGRVWLRCWPPVAWGLIGVPRLKS